MDTAPASNSRADAPAPLSAPPVDHPLRSQHFDSIDDLMAEYSEYARMAGYEVYRTQATNPRIVRGKALPNSYRRYSVVCNLDAIVPSRGHGIRKSGTKKHGCPFKLLAKCPDSIGKWYIDFDSPGCVLTHNSHDPLPASHIGTFKGLCPEAKSIIDAHADDPTMRNRALVELLREEYPEMQFGPRHVKNARARARKSHRNGATHTELLLKLLNEEEGAGYTVKWKNNDAEAGTMDGIYITHKFGDNIIKSHPYTVMFNNTYKTGKDGFAFFQVIVMTPFGVAVPVACGLINTEAQIGFDWLLQQYQIHRARLTNQPLLVATTDFDMAMRNAILVCYPDVCLQLCKFHLNKNVALHILKKWKPRQAGQNQAISQVQERDGGAQSIQQQKSRQVDLDDTISQGRLTAEYHGLVRDLNKVIHSLETGDQPLLPTLESTVEYSQAGVWKLWAVILTRSTREELLNAYESMMTVFHDQPELIMYFRLQVWPFRQQWAHCYTRENLSFGQSTSSPVESINKLLKSFAVTANTAADVLIRQYLSMVRHIKDNYDEQLRRNSVFLSRNFVDKPQFSQVKRKIAEKALILANHQLLKLQRFVRGDQNVSLGSSITRNQGIISAKALHDRHKSETPVLLVEDFNPFWWLTRKEDDLIRYLAINDPDKVLRRSTEWVDSDLAASRLLLVEKLPPSSNSAVATGMQPSAQQTPTSWEPNDAYGLISKPSSAASSAATRGRKRAASSTATQAVKTRVVLSTVSDPDTLDLTVDFD